MSRHVTNRCPMKAFLFAILAILVLSLGPGPAHAVSPSAQLSVTVVPSQSMGRSGPSNCAGADLTPPTVASNAGFTTIVGCWDFTNMSIGAINCDHTNVQTSMSLWLGDPFFGNNVNASCGKNIYFATDQGVNALAAAFGPELANCGNTLCTLARISQTS